MSDTLHEQLRKALPEAVANEPGAAQALARVQQLEQAHAELGKRAAAERAFLERAPREGLQYPGDALKLIELSGEADLDQLFSKLRQDRPWLFAQPRQSPANEKLVATDRPDADALQRAAHKALSTRDLLATRPLRRRT